MCWGFFLPRRWKIDVMLRWNDWLTGAVRKAVLVMKWRNKASFFQFIRSCWYFKRNEITRWRIAQFIRLVTRREASGVSRQSVMQIDGKCHEPKTLHFSLCDKIISLSTKFCFIFFENLRVPHKFDFRFAPRNEITLCSHTKSFYRRKKNKIWKCMVLWWVFIENIEQMGRI